jgi:hypothetical protein
VIVFQASVAGSIIDEDSGGVKTRARQAAHTRSRGV